MWILGSGYYLMPSQAPLDKADVVMTDNGRRNIQVRARLESHLENFIKFVLEPNGLDHSEIEMTPWADYNCRLYMEQKDFAAAMYFAVMQVDYQHFKATSETTDKENGGYLYGTDAKAYHSFLNRMWSVSTDLAPAGGFYGPLSKDNPNGYDRTKKYKYSGGEFRLLSSSPGRGAQSAWWEDDFDNFDHTTGSTFLGFQPSITDRFKEDDEEFLGYNPRSEYAEVLGELIEQPYEVWEHEFDDEDMDLIAEYYPRAHEAYARWKSAQITKEFLGKNRKTRRGKRGGKHNKARNGRRV